MSYPRLAARLYNTALLIEPGKAEVIEAVFRAYAEGRVDTLPAYQAKPAAQPPVPMERTDNGYSLTAGGIAVLPVHGTLVQRGDSLDAMSGLTGYNVISRRLQAALVDPKVKGVVMEFDSPGGEVAGVFELAGQIQAATKPVWAHANEMMFSAAYALGVGAADLQMAQTSMVGSVGVIMLHVDQSQADAKKGLVYTPIYAGARKVDFSSHAPLSDQAQASAQEMVDRLYGIFVDHVAAARAIDPAAVKATEAGLLTPGQALDIGMADGQASLTETIYRMTDELAEPSFNGFSTTRRAGAQPQKGNIMAKPDENAPAITAATNEQLSAARAEGAATATKEAEAKYPAIRSEGATAERARIKAIVTSDAAKERGTFAHHLAFESDMAPEAAVSMLGKTPPEKVTGLLGTRMAGVDNPDIGTDVDKAGKTQTPTIDTANIYDMRRKASGHAAK